MILAAKRAAFVSVNVATDICPLSSNTTCSDTMCKVHCGPENYVSSSIVLMDRDNGSVSP